MDNYVREKLKVWELYEKVAESFDTQEIDEEAFNSLTEKDVEQLIPVLGTRRKFLNRYANYRLIIKSTENPLIFDNDVPSPSTSTDTTLSISSGATNEEELEGSSIDGLVPVHCYPLKATVGLPYVITSTTNFGTQSTVRHLIQETDEGKIIAASYSAGKVFLRSKLSELIIKNELKESKNKRITSTRFTQLAQEINDVFLHEDPDIYYVAYANNVKGKPKAARGKLWNTYTYLRRNFRNLGIIPGSSKDVESNLIEFSNEDCEENLEKLQWLKNNVAPFSLAEEYWRSTTALRQQNLAGSIHEYFQTYPCLKQPLGYTFLEIDFAYLYPGKANSLFSKWPQLFSVILQLAEHKTDSYLKSLISTYKAQYENISPALDDGIFALTILPLMFPCVNIKSKKRGVHWRLSKVEMQNGFLLHVKDMGDLETALERRQQKYAAFHLTAQPLPVVVGEFHNVQACYVCIDDLRYKVDTPLKAIDLCFKVFQTIQAEYPKESEVIWTFIQGYIYNICTKHDAKYVSVSSLISDIGKHTDKN